MGRIFTVPPSPWEVRHAAGIMVGEQHLDAFGTLPDTPVWRMLERRRGLDAARFDRWHPNVGRLIARADAGPSPSCAPIDPPWRHCMRTAPCRAPSQAPQTIGSVPEPSSLVLSVIVLGIVAMLWRGVAKAESSRNGGGS